MNNQPNLIRSHFRRERESEREKIGYSKFLVVVHFGSGASERTFVAIHSCKNATRWDWPNWEPCVTPRRRVPSSRITGSALHSQSLTNWGMCKLLARYLIPIHLLVQHATPSLTIKIHSFPILLLKFCCDVCYFTMSVNSV